MADDVDFSNDVEIAEGYKKFTSEVLRVALLAITGCAVLWLKLKTADPSEKLQIEWLWLDWSFVCFCLAAIAALMHLHLTNASLALELQRRRRTREGAAIEVIVKARNWRCAACQWLIIAGPSLLMIAIVFLGIGVLTAKKPSLKSPTPSTAETSDFRQ